ncbi:uncharacterized protein LOC105439474 [Strongylocentrotus purpuratus]|uniref:Major facilitator superfamily (MFS) profile domain-containing protein n=2 Tax=Strongylocentrotus purpuratus TaxID=7668 RepID=A0A7M7HK29_STRPU|nr:uncharacterized protein LOC105439474 [Strongylocentrotus purpuratus]
MTSFSRGIDRSVGIFQSELCEDLGLTTSELGLAAGFAIGFVYFFAPFVILGYRQLGNPRLIIMVGAICTTCGTIFSSLSLTPVIFCLCFALLGLGSSLVFVSSVIVLKEVAEERFDVMYGIATSGFAFGTIFVPIAAEYLQLIYDWRGAMLILGGLSANIIPFVIAIGPSIRAHVKSTKEDTMSEDSGTETGVYSSSDNNYSSNFSESSPNSTDDEESIGNKKLQKSQIKERPRLYSEDEIGLHSDYRSKDCAKPNNRATRIQIEEQTLRSFSSEKMRTGKDSSSHNRIPGSYECFNKLSIIFESFRRLWEPCLVVLFVAYFVVGMEIVGWRSLFVPRAIHMGLSLTHVNILNLTSAFANFISRLTLGLVMKKSGNSSTVFLCLVILEGLSKFLDVFTLQFPVMLVCSFLSGIALEGMAILPIILGAELLLVPADFDILFVTLELMHGAGFLAGGTISGLIADTMGFNAAYLALAIVNGATFILVVIFKYYEKRRNHASDKSMVTSGLK